MYVHVCVLIWSCTCKYMSVCLHVCVCHSQVPQAALWCLTLSVSIFIFWDRVSFWTQSSPITLGWLISEWTLEICQSLYPKDWDCTHDHCNWLLHRSRGSNSPAQQKGALKRGTCDQTIETMAPQKLEFLQESLAGAREGKLKPGASQRETLLPSRHDSSDSGSDHPEGESWQWQKAGPYTGWACRVTHASCSLSKHSSMSRPWKQDLGLLDIFSLLLFPTWSRWVRLLSLLSAITYLLD